jgi:hypothetical protein
MSVSFFSSLRSLKSLKVAGDIALKMFDAVLKHQGIELENFMIDQHGCLDQVSLKSKEIQRMVESCPHLKKLAIKIPRSQGNINEVAIYKALGSIAKLTSLSLRLDTAMHQLTTDSNSEGDKESEWAIPKTRYYDEEEAHVRLLNFFPGFRREHIEATLINSAVNESLARSIFKCNFFWQSPRESAAGDFEASPNRSFRDE